MDLLMALNVTIYGLGIVFLALLILMVAIMLLTKAFSMATGKDLLAAPTGATATAAAPAVAPAPVAAEAPAPAAPAVTGAVEAVPAPLPGKVLSVAVKPGDRVKAGDELCVIEALKMANSVKSPRDGIVHAVPVAVGESIAFGAPLVLLAPTAAVPGAPRPAPPTAPAARQEAPPVPAAFSLTLSGSRYSVDIRPGDGVAINGTAYQVRRDPRDPARILVDGRPHTVEVRERTATGATVIVNGVAQRVDIASRTHAAPVGLTLTCEGAPHRVEVRAAEEGGGSVTVDGTTFEVKRDPVQRSRLLVNGKAHTVEVKERTAAGVGVWIDGVLQQVQFTGEAAAAAAAPASAPAAAPVGPTPAAAPSAGEPVTAPLPGKVLSVAVKPGDRVKAGDELCVIEALKMGNSIKAQREGIVREVLVSPGQAVAFGAPLLLLG